MSVAAKYSASKAFSVDDHMRIVIVANILLRRCNQTRYFVVCADLRKINRGTP